jgi:hypothetical protein
MRIIIALLIAEYIDVFMGFSIYALLLWHIGAIFCLAQDTKEVLKIRNILLRKQ